MKSVLMPPVPVDKEFSTETKKNKAHALRGIKLNGSTSDYLTKHEWEQVGNETVHQSCKEDAA